MRDHDAAYGRPVTDRLDQFGLLGAQTALGMATNASVALGRPGLLGQIAPGRRADLVVIDRSGAHHLRGGHPVPDLVMHSRGSDVRTVVVNGTVVVDGARHATVDEHATRADAEQALAALRPG
ncbi:amidohydrolase family protein [Blastococcus sp. Marseille-P5729]|uniref:amidohydrolase family protein n=1 Tax=Blastococcus sp. Marseille-P5729 TaxID=2086582 RepID=UPI000D0EAAD4|nr:amidohydrolase family protein [Blastococcus sp. Marseille-P5729]